MNGVEKCGLQLCSSSCFSLQSHWGFSIVMLIQIILLFTIAHYNAIMSAWKYCVPLPRLRYLCTCHILGCLVAVAMECIKMRFRVCSPGKTWNQLWSLEVVSFGQRQLVAVSHLFRKRHWIGWKCLGGNIIMDKLFCWVSLSFMCHVSPCLDMLSKSSTVGFFSNAICTTLSSLSWTIFIFYFYFFLKTSGV